MSLIALLVSAAAVLAGLLALFVLLYILLRVLGAVRRAYLALFAGPRPDTMFQLSQTRRASQQAMDDASKEFLDDIYRQSFQDWSRFK